MEQQTEIKEEVKKLLPNTKGLLIASQKFATEKAHIGGDAFSFRRGFEYARQLLNESHTSLLPEPTQEVEKLINKYWRFDESQGHTSTWHDKQDLLKAIDGLRDRLSDKKGKEEEGTN